MFRRLVSFLFGFTTCGFTLMFLDRIGILNPRILNSRRISNYSPYSQYYRPVTYRPTYHVEEVVDINEAIFDTRKEAEDVLDALNNIISAYGFCTVEDAKTHLDIKTCKYDDNFGWHSLDDAEIYEKNRSFYIEFPMPEELI